MQRPVPSFAVDLMRAALGPALTTPYERAFGAVPWLTAGSLAWEVEDAEDVVEAWARWSATLPTSVLTAMRIGGDVAAIDIAVLGDPYGVQARLAPLYKLSPVDVAVDTIGPRLLRAQASVDAVPVALRRFPDPEHLVDEALSVPAGICLGLRHVHGAPAPLLIAIGAAEERPRVGAAADQSARALAEPVPAT
jgi:hypothetical protein